MTTARFLNKWKNNTCGYPLAFLVSFLTFTSLASAQPSMNNTIASLDSATIHRLLDSALAHGEAYAMLRELTGTIGARLSGSPEAARAVEWGKKMMIEHGLEKVHLQDVMVPHWERGKDQQLMLVAPAVKMAEPLHILALGGSVATPAEGIRGEVIEVQSLDEVRALGERGRGKIIFYNRPMDRSRINTFDAYGGAADQRVSGPSVAASVGAVAVVVRSLTTALDNAPHTGMLRYDTTQPKIPAAAISTRGADLLSMLLHKHGTVQIQLTFDCRTLPDAPSHNVIGELTGTEKPDEVVVIGGHLDSWDVGEGAHDDGAGCVQAIEALRLLKSLGLRPKRTIRAVLYMNEENGARGGKAYAEGVGNNGPRHIAAIESDRGGFAPRGFLVDAGPDTVKQLARWAPLFYEMGADRFEHGGGGVDIEPLKKHDALTIGLNVESHRYFDYHHSANDTFDKVDERELELGAVAVAVLAYLIAEEGL
jgi:hypothetical protein